MKTKICDGLEFVQHEVLNVRSHIPPGRSQKISTWNTSNGKICNFKALLVREGVGKWLTLLPSGGIY
jgi:hypothetical protein